MILKSYIVEQDFQILNNYQATLLYGVNDGIKGDIKSKLKNYYKDDEIINFFEEEIIKKKIFYTKILLMNRFLMKKK